VQVSINVNIAGVVANYFDDLLGPDGAEWFNQLVESLSDAGSAPLAKLQLRLFAEFIADGWRPPMELDLPFDEEFAARVDHSLTRMSHGHHGSALAEVQIEALRNEVVQLRQAMESRAFIEQAKGIVMCEYGLSVERAWAYLVRLSQERSVKVRAVAEEIVSASQKPPLDRRRPATSHQ
jgi:hypothetical protein